MTEDIKSIVTLIIAVMGFLMSLAQLIYTFYCKRINFSISIEKFEWYNHATYDRAIFTLMIWNSSATPLTLTRFNTNNVNCLISSIWIGDRYYPKFPETDIPITERKLSAEFPITLVPNGGGLYSIVFDFEKNSITWERLIALNVQTAQKKKNFLALPTRI